MFSLRCLIVATQAFILAVSAAESSSSGSASRTGTVLSYYIPGFDAQRFVGSVVAADPTATTLKIQCPTGTDASNCGLSGSAEITKKLPSEATGKTTYDGAYTVPTAAVTSSWHCRLGDHGSAKCEITKINAGITAMESGKKDDKAVYQTISVTAGMKKLREAAAAAGSSSATDAPNSPASASSTTGTKATASGNGGATSSGSKSNAKPTERAVNGALVAGMIGVAAMAL